MKNNYILYKIISFLIPIVGWIMYFIFRSEDHEKAVACSNWAWIGFGISFLFNMLTMN